MLSAYVRNLWLTCAACCRFLLGNAIMSLSYYCTCSAHKGQPFPLKPKTTNAKAHIKSRLTILDQQKLHPASIVHCKVNTVDTAQLDWPAALTMACMPYILHMYTALQVCWCVCHAVWDVICIGLEEQGMQQCQWSHSFANTSHAVITAWLVFV